MCSAYQPSVQEQCHPVFCAKLFIFLESSDYTRGAQPEIITSAPGSEYVLAKRNRCASGCGNAVFRGFFAHMHRHVTCVTLGRDYGMKLQTLLMRLLATLLPPVLAMQLCAANLKPETVAAWDDYIQRAGASLQNRIRPGGSRRFTTGRSSWLRRPVQIRGRFPAA